MSYDLYLKPRTRPAIKEEALKHFRSRSNASIEGDRGRCPADMERSAGILGRYGSSRPDGSVLPDYTDQSEDILAVIAFVSSLEPRDHEVIGVQLSKILDEEAVERDRRHC